MKKLTTDQLNGYLGSIKTASIEQKVERAKAIYAELRDMGYNYAGWAEGVASGDSITGQSALDYLQGTAMLGMGGDACRNLTPEQIDKIRVDMAEGYLRTLVGISVESGGSVDRDVTFKEMAGFHREAFKESQLTLDNWTLHTPMEILREMKGDAAVDAVWQRIRDTGGDGLDSLLASSGLAQFMGRLLFESKDPDIQRRVGEWVDQIPGTGNFSQMDKLIDVILKSLGGIPSDSGDPFTGLLWPEQFPGGGNGDGAGGGGGGGAAGGPGSGGGGAGGGATTPPRRDPLVLDLDGDGIETTSTGDRTVILFDHDADGIRTGTGWIKPDDGWLVLDRNGNGTIDSGRELFGGDTIKRNNLLANDGFDALKDLDANNDSKIDSGDSVFANLRIWRDLNQDGISQTQELTTLSASNITSIGVASSAMFTDLGNGNIQTAAGTFTRSNGATGTTGEINGAAANLELVLDTFHRQFTDHVALTDQARALPKLRGSGQVRDLSEAISLSPELGDWVKNYTVQTTRQGQIDKLDGFLEKWANTAELRSLKAQADALATSGVKLNYYFEGLTENTPAHENFVRRLGVVERFMGFTYGGTSGQARFTPLDASSGYVTVSLAAEQIASISLAYERFETDIYESLLLQTRLSRYFNKFEVGVSGDQVVFETQAVENAFRDAISTSPRDGIIDLIEFISAAGETLLKNLNWNALDFLFTQLNSTTAPDPYSAELSSWTVRLAVPTEQTLTGTSRPDLLVGTAAGDYVYGRDGNDILLGKGGNDSIYAEDGNDVIDGGSGNDYLSGGAGADVFRFGIGSGQDTVDNEDRDAVGTNVDRVEFGAAVTPKGVTLSRSGNDLKVAINGTTDTLHLRNYFIADGLTAHAVERLQFADGTNWDVAAVKAALLVGTANAETIEGYGSADTINAGAGNDTVNAREGDDAVYGGDGTDYLYGGGGADVLNGGSGNDSLFGDTGNDTLDGGAGNDSLLGGVGADVFRFGTGSGQDTVYNDDSDAAGTNRDRVEFDAGVGPSGVTLSREDDDLQATINGTTDTLRLSNYFKSDGLTAHAVDTLQFADGTSWDVASVKAALLVGTANADTIEGYDSADTINVGASNDRVTARAGNDTVDGGGGKDTLYGGGGEDVMAGGSGNDTLYGDAGRDSLDGATGNDHLSGGDDTDALSGGAGNDSLDGGTGNDTLEGGTGNDTLRGGDGADVYHFDFGSGLDTISNYDFDAPGVNPDVLQLGNGIGAGDVTVRREGTSLVVVLNASGERVVVSDHFEADGGTPNAIDLIRFADGTTWDGASVKLRVLAATPGAQLLSGYASADTLSGGGGNDTLTGSQGADVLDGGIGHDLLDGGEDSDLLLGGTGNDQLLGGSGSDQLDGGHGDDTLRGGDGADVYLFGIGSGTDLIINADDDATGSQPDTIKLAAGITRADVQLIRRNDDLDHDSLVIKINGSSDALTVQHHFAIGGSEAIDRIEFNDGTWWDANEIASRTTTASLGTQHGGSSYDDVLTGGAGDDTLWGSTGADTLDGGAGDDLLGGGSDESPDVFVFGRGSDRDTAIFFETRGRDVVHIGDSVLPSDVTLNRVDHSLVMSINGTDDSLTIRDYLFNDDEAGADTAVVFLFRNGTAWTVADIRTMAPAQATASDDNDVLLGQGASDSISGLEGDDKLDGRDGNDTLDGGQGSDLLYGGLGDDILQGGSESDWLVAGSGKDALNGGRGDDVLNAQDGDDTLDGGAGNDELFGGGGADVFVFGRGYGNDTIHMDDSMPSDIVQLRDDVAADDVDLKRDGSDLVLSIKGTTDTLRMKRYFDDYFGGHNVIGSIRFGDGTSWDVSHVMTQVLKPSGDNDTLYGYAGGQVIQALAGDDVVFGGSGDDLVDGGDGEDSIQGAYGNDTLNGGGDSDTLYGSGGNDLLLGQDGDDVLYGDEAVVSDSGNDTLHGGAGDDSLGGGAGNDLLEGGAGADILLGESGDDTYLFGRGDGADTILRDLDNTPGRLNVLQFKAGIPTSDVSVSRSGDALRLTINGTQDFVTVNDFFLSGNPVQEVRFDDGVWNIQTLKEMLDVRTIIGTSDNDTLTGSEGVERFEGGAGDDMLLGGAGNDWLDGGAGADQLVGGSGNDVYVLNNDADATIENADEGIDTVQTLVSATLGDNLENLRLIGTGTINGTGNARDNVITGNSANNVLAGGLGADTMIGGDGNDRYLVTDTSDTIIEAAGGGVDTVDASVTWSLGAEIENLVLSGSGPIDGIGNALANAMDGNAAANRLDGASGVDTLRGHAGDDTFVVDGADDVVIEQAGEGLDTVEAAAPSWMLGDNIENLTLTYWGDGDGTGNDLNNRLLGNEYRNRLDGGAGADTLVGGGGDDTYVVDTSLDVVNESAEGGIDTVESSVSWMLIAELEKLTLTGSSAIDGTGNAAANTLRGNSASNVLDGGAGKDTMVGGAGDDTYRVDSTGDVVTESVNQGADTVESTVSLTLASNVEHLTLLGSSALNANGNSLDNVLRGNSGINTLSGGTGNDIYVVGTGDSVVEAANSGIDTVQSSVTWTLAANVENLALTGSSTINGSGNTLNNVLTGNSASNVLTGGAGNDTYVVGEGDTVVEAASQGTDTVQSSTTWTLENNVEQLILTGAASINGAGNTLSNVLSGNAGNNVLTGLAGADTLDGGAGIDTLNGGAGADTYLFARGHGRDTVQDNDATSGVKDKVQFATGIVQADLTYSHVGNNLEALINGTSDKLVFQDWYLGNQYHVEEFRFGDGTMLTDSQVQGLVSAMAGFNVPTSGIASSSSSRQGLQTTDLAVGALM